MLFLSSPMIFVGFKPGPVGYNPIALKTKRRLLPRITQESGGIYPKIEKCASKCNNQLSISSSGTMTTVWR